MFTVNIPQVLVVYEHAMLFLLELLFQWNHQYVQSKGFPMSSLHASYVEQKMVFRSNMQVFGSTCGSHGSNQYQGDNPHFLQSVSPHHLLQKFPHGLARRLRNCCLRSRAHFGDGAFPRWCSSWMVLSPGNYQSGSGLPECDDLRRQGMSQKMAAPALLFQQTRWWDLS